MLRSADAPSASRSAAPRASYAFFPVQQAWNSGHRPVPQRGCLIVRRVESVPGWTRRAARGSTVIALLAGVAVAFADSSIVVLALPDLLRRFDVSIPAVAWTITAYNLVLAVSALVLVRAARRLDAGRLAWSGSLLFLIASVACGLAWGLWPLVAFRSGQGLGAALLLVGSLPLLRACATTPARGTSLWAGAGVFGAALGPAAGGLLTQLLSWHAIFFAQAPIAALAFA